MADQKKPTKSAPIVDVAQPGKSAPSATSKSIIVSHKPMVSDPMVVDDKSRSQLTNTPMLRLSVSDEVTVDKPEEPTESVAPAEQIDVKGATPTEPVEASKPDEPAEPAEPTDTPGEADKPVAGTTKTKDPAADAQAEIAKQAEHDTTIQQLIDSKDYFLPINVVEQRRSRRIVILGIILSLVLVVVWVDIALDAGLIKISGVKAVTHFFSN